MNLKKRVDEQMKLHGEDLLVNGVTPAKGFFMLTDLTHLNTFFDSYEISGLNKPVLTLQVGADTQIGIDDTVQRDGRTYMVKKLAKFRAGSQIVMQTAVLT